MNIIPGMPQGKWYKVSCDRLLYTGDGSILMVVAHHTSTTTLELNDSTDGTGADVISFQVPANDTLIADFSAVGGVPFATACWADWGAGTVWVLLTV